jgi:hypothetical protein
MHQQKESSYCETPGFLDVNHFFLLVRNRIRNAIPYYFANCKVIGGYRSVLYFCRLKTPCVSFSVHQNLICVPGQILYIED